MNVTLLDYTHDALDLLVATKQTRLSFTPEALGAVKAWPLEKKLAELNYMLGTIESSWEFCSFTFLISGVSRAFTHQLVRSRHASYAQQSQRTVDMSGFQYVATGILAGPEEKIGLRNSHAAMEDWLGGDEVAEYHDGMRHIERIYNTLVNDYNVPPQDARGLLPTNVATAIIMKVDLRELSHMAALRLCTRTQGEYQEVFKLMRGRVIEVYDWAEPFLRVHCARHGVCAFPHYKECPIKGSIFNPDTGRRWDHTVGDDPKFLPLTRDAIQESWVQLQRAGGFEARPKQMVNHEPS